MLKLDFKINKVYLYAKIIKQFKLLGEVGNILEKRLWDKSKISYSLISGACYDDRIAPRIALDSLRPKDFSKGLIQSIELTEKILIQELESKEFIKILKETEDYLKRIKEQWSKNKRRALNHLKDITGLELPNKNLSVYLVHPKLYDGRYWHENGKDIITWGHPEDWENYSTVYLCHEIMHFLTKEYEGDKKFLHALIELACDNELRLRLNKKGKYFRDGEHEIGHKSLRKIEKKFLPTWQKYLQKKKKEDNILQLAQQLEGNDLK